jgi:hypothetical protein
MLKLTRQVMKFTVVSLYVVEIHYCTLLKLIVVSLLIIQISLFKVTIHCCFVSSLPFLTSIKRLLWSSYDRTWFSGPDKQEILKRLLLCIKTACGIKTTTTNRQRRTSMERTGRRMGPLFLSSDISLTHYALKGPL